jgi:threonine dehydrogenase-like Zn-dependent dehydrogenase
MPPLPLRVSILREQREFMSGAQAPFARIPLADGTLVATPEMPSEDLIPSLLAVSDVLGTGWYAADAARVQPGSTAVVVGDRAVGLMGVLSAKQMGAEKIIAMSKRMAGTRPPPRAAMFC